jgi:PAS domain S-box-containing protein
MTTKGDEDTLLRSVALQNANSILVAQQRAARRQEAYLAEAQSLSHTGSFSWNISTGELIWSDETFRIFQYDPATEPTVERVLQRVHPEDAALVRQTIERASQEGRDFDFEHRLLMPDGSIKHLHVVAHAETDESAGIEFIGAVMDVTAAKEAANRIRRSEAYLHEAQRVGHTGSWRHDVVSGAMTISPEACRMWGVNVDDDVSATEFFFGRMHPEDRAAVEHVYRAAHFEKAEFRSDFRVVLPDGAVKNIHTVGHPILNESGDIVEFVGAVIDVTERKRAEEALRQAQADLAHVSRVTTMGELTASLAHEVKQPIAAAVTDANTCVRWLARVPPDIDEARAAAMRVVEDGRRATDIINRIRLPFTKGALQRERVDVNELIREMIVLLRSEATRHAISVRTALDAGLPAVMGDRVQLQQVLMNLIMNSIDAMAAVEGPRDLAMTSQRDGDQLLVSVSDTGVGLPPQADQIFNAFFTTKDHGIGMGLSISRSIVKSHGGRLWAADHTPRGAILHLSLPTAPSTPADVGRIEVISPNRERS